MKKKNFLTKRVSFTQRKMGSCKGLGEVLTPERDRMNVSSVRRHYTLNKSPNASDSGPSFMNFSLILEIYLFRLIISEMILKFRMIFLGKTAVYVSCPYSKEFSSRKSKKSLVPFSRENEMLD